MQTIQDTLLHLSTDWIILALLLIVLAIDGVRSGITRTAALVAASGITLALYPLLAHTVVLSTIVGNLSTPVLQAALFGGLYIFLFLVLFRIIHRYDSYSPGLLYALLSALAATASIATVWIASGVLQNVWRFGAPVTSLFGSSYALLWLLGSLIVISIVRS